MNSPIFANDENIPLVSNDDEDRNNDNDYDDYNTPTTTRVDETAFTMPDYTDR